MTFIELFSWIIDNVEHDIIADFAHHQTSKALWDNLAITFEGKADPYQIYDLEDKIMYMRQGNLDVETYYRRLHGLWINIDRTQKQPVTCCDKGIGQYRQHANDKRLIKFLTGLNQEYDHIRREILKEQPYPSVEEAYGWVKKEAARQRIMPPASAPPIGDSSGIGSVDASSGEVGYGFGAQRDRPSNRGSQQRPPPAGNNHQTA
ncbi:uncharacterized protein LOC121774359 [Salvia splendens]|uniref:uncharacterized protein LOC121774359 n=1 Tax=Salvia splendens TaxID=180675 RepID=UPI001C27E71D|nr:uncharacterized protein LOC121774359 [Salvia splendens]